MAIPSHTQTFDQIQTFADVKACTARVSAFRRRMWPAKRQAELPAPAPLPSPAPAEPVHLPVGRITVRVVLDVTAAHFGTTVDAMLSDSRKKPLVRHRQIAMHIAHKLTGRSLPFIGRTMGGRDHTTILAGVRKVQALIDAGDGDTVAAVEAITGRLTGGANG